MRLHQLRPPRKPSSLWRRLIGWCMNRPGQPYLPLAGESGYGAMRCRFRLWSTSLEKHNSGIAVRFSCNIEFIFLGQDRSRDA